MKIFVFSDVHGNKHVLNAIKNNSDFITADEVYFLGDFITFGPNTEEVVSWFRNKNIKCVIGNNDSYVVNGLAKEESKEKSKAKLKHLEDVYNELSSESVDFLKSLPKQYEAVYGGKKFLFTHYAWGSNTEVKDDPTNLNDTTVINAFNDVIYDYIIYGHIHVPTTYKVGNKNLIGVGASGTLYPANYLVININNNIDIKRKLLKHDVESFKADLSKCTDKSRQFFYSIIDEELSMAERWKQ